MGVSGQRHAQAALLPPGKGPPVPIVQEAGWAPEPVWTQRIDTSALAKNLPRGPQVAILWSNVVQCFQLWTVLRSEVVTALKVTTFFQRTLLYLPTSQHRYARYCLSIQHKTKSRNL
jgi:hypothetical protein